MSGQLWRNTRRLIFGATDKRVRASLRVAFPIFVVLAGTLLVLIVAAVLEAIGLLDSFLADNMSSIVSAAFALGLLIVMAKYVDHRPIKNYGFRFSQKWWSEFAVGLTIGGLLATAMSVAAVGVGGAVVVEIVSPGIGPFLISMLFFAVVFACVAFWEEVIFRGLFITNAVEGLVMRGLSYRIAIGGAWLCSSVVFALIHVPFSSVEGVSFVTAVAGWILSGGLLGLAYIVSGELAFPLGFHFLYNYVLNSVFGSTEFQQTPTVIRIEWVNPDLWHPNGGLFPISLTVTCYGVVAGWYYWRNDGLTFDRGIARK